MKLITFLCVCFLFVAGCQTVTDPLTGDQHKRLKPEAAETLDKLADAAEPAAGLVSVLVPGGAAIGGLLAGAAGAWRRLKPRVTSAKGEADMYRDVTEFLVLELEKFKVEHPVAWADLKGKIGNRITENAEAIIDAIRKANQK